jgi:uncharacterized protein
MDKHAHTLQAADHPAPVPIVAREQLNFDFSGDIPRHWLAGDPFKTRFFDAMSTLFPEGERFFIACVRDYKDQVSDPAQQQAMLDFAKQEAQHTRFHRAYNQRLSAQGIKVDRIVASQRDMLFGFARKVLPKSRTLAMTAAAEHLTATMSEGFLQRDELFAEADPRVRALYAWHGIEEIEHKGVAYDILTDIARVGYIGRCWALIATTLHFTLIVCNILNHMLKVDGYSRRQRWALWLKGLYWLWGPKGLLLDLVGPYMAWFKPGYHPWQSGAQANIEPRFAIWSDTLRRTGDPVEAANALHAQAPSGHPVHAM